MHPEHDSELIYRVAVANFKQAESGFVNGRYVGESRNLPYEKLNTLITGLRSIIAIEQTSGYEPQVAEMKARAKHILDTIGA